MKAKKSFLALLLLAAASMFLSCGQHVDPYVFDGVNWNGDNSGTLELINGSNKDMVIFVGQQPAQSSMLGGVRAGATKKYDISKHVSDFNVGGYAIIRGVSKEEYDKIGVLRLNEAKIEFTAMVTYKGGAIYRYNIDPNYMGDFAFRVENNINIGIELRKNSPDGEKVAYLPALQRNQMVYTSSSDAVTLFPVYVFFNKLTAEVNTIRSTSIYNSVNAAPRPLMDKAIQTYRFPNSEQDIMKILDDISYPVAYINVTSNIDNQSAYFANAGLRLFSQRGFDAIGTGEQLLFEIASSDAGTEKDLRVLVYNHSIPVRFAGETTPPIIKNGWDYTVSVSVVGTDIADPASYRAIIREDKKRNAKEELLTSL